MTPRTALRLGRVSNLPTVWTNAMAGAALAGGAGVFGAESADAVALAALSLSLSYVGGMWLNDAFDAGIDARERPERPIPAGLADRRTVFAAGFALLAAGALAAFALGSAAGVCGLLLAAAIVLYDWVHKRTALAPLIMGATRLLAYGLGALAVGALTPVVLLGAAGLGAHVVGLTYAARGEARDRLGAAWPLAALAAPAALAAGSVANAAGAAALTIGALTVGAAAALGLWAALALALRRLARRARGDVPKAVVTMIAAIALYDAALIAATGATAAAAAAAACFLLTLALQRVAAGT